jgi:hypothetical protein
VKSAGPAALCDVALGVERVVDQALVARLVGEDRHHRARQQERRGQRIDRNDLRIIVEHGSVLGPSIL